MRKLWMDAYVAAFAFRTGAQLEAGEPGRLL